MPIQKSLSRVVTLNTISGFLLQGISFFSAPIFTRLLLPVDYGNLSIYMTWLGILSLFIGLQSHGSIANARISYPQEEMNSYLSSTMSLSLCSFIVFFLISLFFYKDLSKVLDIKEGLIIFICVQSFSTFVVNFYTTKWMQFKEVEKNVILSLSIAIITVILSIIFVYIRDEDKYIGKIFGSALPQITVAIVFLFLIYKKGRCFYKKEYWKYCLVLALPLIFHGAGGMILSQSDRIMLKKFIGSEEVGIYSVGYSLALVISSIWYALNTSWIPFYYDYKKNKQRKLIIEKAGNYMLIFSFLTMGFILLAPEVFKIMTPPSYWNGIKIIPFIALAYYLNFLYSLPASNEFFYQKTVYISIGTLAAAGINVFFNLLLIPDYAGMGAAIATVIAHVFSFLFHDIISRFIVKDLEYSFLFYMKGLLPVLCIIVLYYFTFELWYLRWGLGFCLGVYLTRRIIKKRSLF